MSLAEHDIREFLEHLSEGFLVTDRTGNILYANNRLSEMFGYPAGELIGKSVDILIPHSKRARHVTDRGTFFHNPERRTMGTGRDLVGRKQDGNEIPIEVSLAPISRDGTVVVYALVSDISKRKNIEDTLEEERGFTSVVLETLGALVVVLDRDGRIIRFNRACQETTGYSLEEVEGRSMSEFLIPEDELEQVEAIFEDIHSGNYPNSAENHWMTRGGLHRRIAWSNTAITDSAGNVKHVVATGIDVTERRRLEEQYIQAQKMEAVGRLAGGVAHDFNNVLNVISFDSELLMDQLDDPASRELLEEISKVIDRGASIVRELLTFSRPQAIQPTVVDLGAVVEDTRRMLQVLVGESVTLEFTAGNEPATVRIDRSQMEQVLMNLAANARDAMPEGGKMEITIDSQFVDRERSQLLGIGPGNFVRISVTDNGTGIEESVRERIFEPFFTTKEVGKGTGLGLSTTYGIITRAGGTIECSSELGSGTKFETYLPATANDNPKTIADRTPDPTATGVGTILLVEDEEQLKVSMRRALEGGGYTVLTAEDGDQAQNISRDHPGAIDLLVTDMVLPKLRGAELSKRLTADRPEMKTLFISGYANENEPESGHRFLAKPFKRQVLLELVGEILDD